jgi:hypothetical protein
MLIFLCLFSFIQYITEHGRITSHNIGGFIKEVLRRENQGLKVYRYTVDRSSVFSMTGTYF